MSIQEQIQQQVKESPVVLYMKGTPDFPMCGFSAKVVHILRECGVDFVGVNVMEDEAIREGIKLFSSWPTIPQLYVNAEFIGGCDIVTELYASGELQKLFEA